MDISRGNLGTSNLELECCSRSEIKEPYLRVMVLVTPVSLCRKNMLGDRRSIRKLHFTEEFVMSLIII